ncbi:MULTISPECIES: DUF2637 domain-containing protein [unclassified Streptomyces]|uniref:DUF2637 domain-containing protein n=1 Tax=unclassified Streptomyces TaxID=2593676 RepID=UPI00081F113C|nr:DUF2637 domain-containing protein [Streptomyces sp. LcepLS]MYR30475.1 DUF2637 domain-containing protein [Streptomyces sp. SID4945]SCF49895.1 Protein of unknown function [Streptomyces sp. LcepLS]
MAATQLTRTHRILVGVVVAGAVIIAGIGFAGSYAAVRELALEKGFGNFSYVLPIGIDAGICVLLALDLLLTWIRIPFPLLRQTAWLLTAATIAFNGAAAWPDPLGVGMHAVIPVLFVVSVEAARHAIGRIADITADRHMEGVRITRWLLSPVPTFLLWRRMKLWELRSYEEVIKLEQERLVYRARLRSRFGRAWRRKAPVESLMPLRLARYGVPLAETAPDGLAAAGIDPSRPVVARVEPAAVAEAGPRAQLTAQAPEPRPVPRRHQPPQPQAQPRQAAPVHEQPAAQDPTSPWFKGHPQAVTYQGGYDPSFAPEPHAPEPYAPPEDPEYPEPPADEEDPRFAPRFHAPYQPQHWYEEQQGHDENRDQAPEQWQEQAQEQGPQEAQEQGPQEAQGPEPIQVPAGPHRTRPLAGRSEPDPGPRIPGRRAEADAEDGAVADAATEEPDGDWLPDDMPREEALYDVFRQYVREMGGFPNSRQFGRFLLENFNVRGPGGGPLPQSELTAWLDEFQPRYTGELDVDAPA